MIRVKATAEDGEHPVEDAVPQACQRSGVEERGLRTWLPKQASAMERVCGLDAARSKVRVTTARELSRRCE